MNFVRITFLHIGVIVAAGFTFLGVGCKKPDAKTHVRNELQKLYDAQAVAMEKRDINGAMAYYAADFVAVNGIGQSHDLSAERRDVQAAFKGPLTRFSTVISDVTLDNPQETQATVTKTQHAEGTVSAAGQTGTLAFDAKMRDFWAKENGHWYLKRGKILSIQALANGKPVQ